MRELHGWFGPPWPSGVCYHDDGRLNTAMRKDFPTGESCAYCGVLLDEAAGDAGIALPAGLGDGVRITHVHKECVARMTIGGVAHLQRRCSCYGGAGDHEVADKRAEALEVWDWIQQHGSA
jgi:hypothetical protein